MSFYGWAGWCHYFSALRMASNTNSSMVQTETGHQLLVLTTSREYGLDDILFGPPERHAIQRSQVPVMLINPRADLFSLCD